VKQILLIAKREFVATAGTRAFVIGLLVLPAIIGIFTLIGPRLFNPKNYEIKGTVLVMDPTARVLPEMETTFSRARFAERRKEDAESVLSKAPGDVRQMAFGKPTQDAIGAAIGPIPDIQLQQLPAGSNIDKESKWLNIKSGAMPHLALIVIHSDAAESARTGMPYGSYDLYVSPNLDERARGEIQRCLREALVNARLKARSMDKAAIDAIVRVPNVRSITVTKDNRQQTVTGFNMLLPAVFGFLLLMGVMGGGGQLLTTMVEEKANRVVELLLSAVSPLELMAGKLLGQMCVSLVGMILYIAMGLAMLGAFALFGLFDFSLIFYLLIFFLITYLLIGSLMMAVGSAVNDMKEAQGLMAPLMIIFMIPWFLWFPISGDPNSVLSVVMSFTPFVNNFAMLLRVASNTPPPFWQVWISIAIGAATAWFGVWLAAKIFRIGLLMYGKPPNFATLVRWARAA
jgi:ABC-2 type transport system permease protein